MTIIRSAAIALAGAALSACSVGPQAEYADAEPVIYTPPVAAFAGPPPPDYAPPPAVLDGAPRYPEQRYAAPRRASCDIRVRSTRNGVSITPVATLGRSVAGEYDLVLTTSGQSGSSDVTQGGPFRASAGETVTLGQTELSLGRRDRYRAVLTLTDRGREICRREVRS